MVRFFEFIRAFGCERDRSAAANLLTRDEARRIDAANIVKLPELPPAVVGELLWQISNPAANLRNRRASAVTWQRQAINDSGIGTTELCLWLPQLRAYIVVSETAVICPDCGILRAPRLCCQALPTLWSSEWRTTGKTSVCALSLIVQI